MGPALALGGLGIIGGVMQNNAQKQAQEAANETNIAIARENRQWQEQMANTAHTREVADLKAAGLNPILTATGGSGAATPSPPSPTVGAARVEDVVSKGVSSASQAYQLDLQKRSTEGQLALNDASIAQAAAQTAQSITNAKKAQEETKGVAIDNAVKTIALPAVKNEAKLREVTADYNTKAAGYDAIMNRALDAIGGFAGSFGKLFRPGDVKTNLENKTLRNENKTMKNYINSGKNPGIRR